MRTKNVHFTFLVMYFVKLTKCEILHTTLVTYRLLQNMILHNLFKFKCCSIYTNFNQTKTFL